MLVNCARPLADWSAYACDILLDVTQRAQTASFCLSPGRVLGGSPCRKPCLSYELTDSRNGGPKFSAAGRAFHDDTTAPSRLHTFCNLADSKLQCGRTSAINFTCFPQSPLIVCLLSAQEGDRHIFSAGWLRLVSARSQSRA